MNRRNLIAISIFALVVVGIWQLRVWREAQLVRSLGGVELSEQKPESKWQMEQRVAAEAKTLFARAITNDVIGYHRTIKADEIIFANMPPSNWWATAEVEFINRLGGVQRTNLHYRFGVRWFAPYIYQINDRDYYEFLTENSKTH